MSAKVCSTRSPEPAAAATVSVRSAAVQLSASTSSLTFPRSSAQASTVYFPAAVPIGTVSSAALRDCDVRGDSAETVRAPSSLMSRGAVRGLVRLVLRAARLACGSVVR